MDLQTVTAESLEARCRQLELDIRRYEERIEYYEDVDGPRHKIAIYMAKLGEAYAEYHQLQEKLRTAPLMPTDAPQSEDVSALPQQESGAAPHAPTESRQSESGLAPPLGERILLLVLRTREERANIPGDLEEEFRQIAAKHGARYAKLWYYKQVAASAWPMVRKAVRWGLLAWVEEWIRRRV